MVDVFVSYSSQDREKVGEVVREIEAMGCSVWWDREIGAGAAFADWRAQEVYPGPEGTTTTDIRKFVLRAADSFHHPVGTCRIGAVVDEALRVKGVAGLRVIDASVFPGIPQAMTNAATIAVAEKASDLVLAG